MTKRVTTGFLIVTISGGGRLDGRALPYWPALFGAKTRRRSFRKRSREDSGHERKSFLHFGGMEAGRGVLAENYQTKRSPGNDSGRYRGGASGRRKTK